MKDKINEKVISIFAKHSKKTHTSEDEQVFTTPDGFKYVHIKADDNGHNLDEKKIIEKSDSQWYIIKVLEYHKGYPTIKNFKVSGQRLVEFLEAFINDTRPGKIIEIDKYYPEGTA